MSRKLTQKQEAFCLAYIELGNASDAYRSAYEASRMKPETVNRTAKEQLDNPKIAARIKDLQAEAAERNAVTVDSLLAELEDARQLAFRIAQPAAAVTATMGKAKIVGLDKLVLDHRSSDRSMTPTALDKRIVEALVDKLVD